MASPERHILKVFISYVREDYRKAEKIYKQLRDDGVDVWLDKHNLLPGQDWEANIADEVEKSDAIIVCLSRNAVQKDGFFQKEITYALDKVGEKPENSIFIIPVKLEECNIPRRLSKYQYVDFLHKDGETVSRDGYSKIVKSLNLIAGQKGAVFQPQYLEALGVNGVEFGQIVVSLREDLGFTTEKLAEQAELDYELIVGIENGSEKVLNINVLNSLCYALELTNLERREFLLAASGVVEKEVGRLTNKISTPYYDIEEIINKIIKLVYYLRVPAFVTDVYSDVILSNVLALAFLGIKENLVVSAADMVSGYNMMRILFDPNSNYREFVGKDWELHALLNVRFFRRMSLRYRANTYFSDLMSELKKFPLFVEYYEKALKEDSDEFTSYAVYKLENETLGAIQYTGTEIFLATTPCGELYLHIYLPLNEDTEKMFIELFQRFKESCIPFAPFPDSRKWKPHF